METDLTSTLHPLMWGVIEDLPEEESLEKALADGIDPAWLMKGFASSEAYDKDGHVIEQPGIDWSEYDALPRVHYTHPYHATKLCGDGVKRERRMVKGLDGNYVEVLLNRHLALGRKVRDDHLALCKGYRKQGLGFSVEGKIVEMRGHRITKSIVRTLAIDGAPRNQDSMAMPLAAALGGAMGYQNFPPELAKAAMRLAYDPDIQNRLALIEGVPLNELRALRLLRRPAHRGKTLLAALERVAGM